MDEIYPAFKVHNNSDKHYSIIFQHFKSHSTHLLSYSKPISVLQNYPQYISFS